MIAKTDLSVNHEIIATCGRVSDYLECDPHEILGQEWRRFISADSGAEMARMDADLKAHRPGRYAGTAISKSGVRLYMSCVTFRRCIVGTFRSITTLEAFESPRTTLLLRNMLKCGWVMYLVPLGECAWNLVHLVQ